MRTSRLDGKEVQRCVLLFMLLICKSLSWKSLCLLLTATRNASFSSLVENAYSEIPGLQYWRRRGDSDFLVLFSKTLVAWTGGLQGRTLGPLGLQEEGHPAKVGHTCQT